MVVHLGGSTSSLLSVEVLSTEPCPLFARRWQIAMALISWNIHFCHFPVRFFKQNWVKALPAATSWGELCNTASLRRTDRNWHGKCALKVGGKGASRAGRSQKHSEKRAETQILFYFIFYFIIYFIIYFIFILFFNLLILFLFYFILFLIFNKERKKMKAWWNTALTLAIKESWLWLLISADVEL